MNNKREPDGEHASEVELVPEPEFQETMRKILATTKQESDEQLARFQASNRERREQRRGRG